MPDTIFTQIINKQIPVKVVFEDDTYLAFNDIMPQAPVHVLIIPKRQIPMLRDLTEADAGLVGGMLVLASKLMKEMGHADYRTVFNCGEGAGQSVFHIHLHVLAGREFAWPPG